ncbi:carbamoyl phosphate synthase-like protein [Planctomycetes bacterium Poly30]|uniref:Carbamoyl phosphate synthase-like protein n=1 Tax=Saltatorellus ferox TaxID=2528018 RepID=A0A518EWG6_9BACT|nr:carbamoyl phosphate synthase-like protein [Planctomycetes bacterium Poly30]
MIFLDQPYVSDFLKRTIREFELPVVLTQASRAFGADSFPSAITEEEARVRVRATPNPKLYQVSESSIGWVTEHLGESAMPARIEQFKNKASFRVATAALFPDLGFREIPVTDLDDFDPASFPAPFVIKPTVGFFSLGVQRVESAAAWPAALAAIRADVARAAGLFPAEVLGTASFLVEQCIEGREYAIDAYYDEKGEPIVLSILEHLFASKDDASDRVYITSAEIVRANLPRFTRHLQDLGEVFDVRNFPVHVEVRVDAEGRVIPIEVNPMRFGGWCTTADLTYHAFGVNPYACYFRGERPDWDALLDDPDSSFGNDTFALVALGNTSGIDGKDIAAFDHDALLARFARPLELRKTDFRRYPIFGFVYARSTPEQLAELDWALRSDLAEFVTRA